MRNTLLFIFILLLPIDLVAQETLGKVVNTLKERINLSAYAQLGYTYNSAADPDNTFDIKRVILWQTGRLQNVGHVILCMTLQLVLCRNYIQVISSCRGCLFA